MNSISHRNGVKLCLQCRGHDVESSKALEHPHRISLLPPASFPYPKEAAEHVRSGVRRRWWPHQRIKLCLQCSGAPESPPTPHLYPPCIPQPFVPQGGRRVRGVQRQPQGAALRVSQVGPAMKRTVSTLGKVSHTRNLTWIGLSTMSTALMNAGPAIILSARAAVRLQRRATAAQLHPNANCRDPTHGASRQIGK